MKKKIIAVLLALMLIPAAAFATPLFQVGPLVAYNRSAIELGESTEGLTDINNFSFGADVRLNIANYFSLDVPATIGFGSEGAFTAAAIPTVNFNIPILGLVDIALGVGTQFDFQHINDEWTMNGLPFDSASEAFEQSKLVYRAGVTVNLSFLSIGLNATVPCTDPFTSDDIGGIFPPVWESTRVSAVVLFNFD